MIDCRIKQSSLVWVVAELVAMLFFFGVMVLKTFNSCAGNLQRCGLGTVVISSGLCRGNKLAWACGAGVVGFLQSFTRGQKTAAEASVALEA